MLSDSPDIVLDPAFVSIEEAILPTLSEMIDALLETASLARPGFDAERQAAALRALALELEGVTREVEAIGVTSALPAGYVAAASPARICA
jgi:hypothetical protein